MTTLDQLFEEIAPLLKKTIKKQSLEPYGRGKDYNWEAVKADIAAGFRICTRCTERRAITEFSKRTAHVTGYKAWCKACDKVVFATHRAANLETMRAQDREKHYTRKYKLDPELSKILADPTNRIMPCPLCRQTKLLVLDHDHTTGVVRGLICSACNSMLGYAAESLDTLYEAIAYLKKHKGV